MNVPLGEFLDELGNEKGLYKKEDEALANNLLGKEKNSETEEGFNNLKAFVQDYMDRIIHKKLSETKY